MSIYFHKPRIPRPGARDGERGQDLVEFALVAPLLILLLFGVIQLGHLIMQYNTVANAARDGARHGIIMQTAGSNTSGTVTCANPSAYPIAVSACSVARGLDPNLVKVMWNEQTGVISYFKSISVTVTYQSPIVMLGYIGFPATLPLSATSVMQKEQ